MADTTTSKEGMTVWGAMFLGIGALVGAGIFALLGEAGAPREVAANGEV